MTDKQKYYPKYYVKPQDVHSELRKKMQADGFNYVLDIEKSTGPYFYDARNGNKYLDFFTCFASMPIGMNHPKMMNDEFINYMGRIAMNKPSNSDLYSEVMAALVKTMSEIGNLEDFRYYFFISGGALAVENALKTAFDWKVRKNFKKGFQTEKGKKVIHFRQAFHGRTGYTMSLTNTDPNKTRYFTQFDWPRIENPKIDFPAAGKNIEKVIEKEKQAVEQIKKVFAEDKDDIAAIIIEPIQGEGGDNHFRREFLQQLRNLADENDTLLVFDEIQTGVGITGKMWAYQHFGVVPDIMCFGKKMQICGIAVTDRIDEIHDNVFHVPSRINSTWGGNLTDMARATKYLEIIDEDNLIQNAAEQGEIIMSNLRKLEENFPHIISNVRGIGMFCAFDMPDSDIRSMLRNQCFEEGLFILPCGEKSLRFRPALNISEANINDGFKIIETAMNKII